MGRVGVGLGLAEGVDDVVEVEADFLGLFEEGLAGRGDEVETLAAARENRTADDHSDAGTAGEVAGGFELADDLVIIAGLRYDRYTSDDSPVVNQDFASEYGFANDATVDGDILDLLLKWRTAEQGFEIVEIR